MKHLYNSCPYTFIHFSNVDIFDVNPNFNFKTPIGIYGYPTNSITNLNEQSFACNRKFATIFKSLNFLELTSKTTTNVASMIYDACTDFDLLPDYEIFQNEYLYQTYLTIQNTYLKAKGYGPNSKSKKNPCNILTQIFQHAGFDGIVDRGTGTIHMNEPSQGVFFNKSKLEIIDLISL